jgi:hypothetical protein
LTGAQERPQRGAFTPVPRKPRRNKSSRKLKAQFLKQLLKGKVSI